jgi:hypothetical protein
MHIKFYSVLKQGGRATTYDANLTRYFNLWLPRSLELSYSSLLPCDVSRVTTAFVRKRDVFSWLPWTAWKASAVRDNHAELRQ